MWIKKEDTNSQFTVKSDYAMIRETGKNKQTQKLHLRLTSVSMFMTVQEEKKQNKQVNEMAAQLMLAKLHLNKPQNLRNNVL